MAKVFITLTGTKHYFGNDFLEKGTKIRLEKEPKANGNGKSLLQEKQRKIIKYMKKSLLIE